MRLGFIGTGGITTAIVTGLSTCTNPTETIWVSPRNREKAEHLKDSYPSVHVGATNQEVVDESDIVFLAILPQLKEEILAPLNFRKEQIIVHILAGTTIDSVRPLVAPAEEIVRAVPLPCTAIHVGPIAIYPARGDASHTISGLFGYLGHVIPVSSEEQLETLAIITALMAPYYAMVEEVVSWGEEQGIDRKSASDYTLSMFSALSAIAESDEKGDIGSMVSECMTPGGLNELAMKVINGNGGFAQIRSALEAVRVRHQI